MFGLGVGIAQGGHRIRPVAQITADFIKNRYRGGIGPGFFDLFDFVAAGNRTYINALGHMMTAGINVPRTGHHAYQGGKWVPVGLLLEPDGQNDVPSSEDLANTDAWAVFNDCSSNLSGTIAGIPAFEIEDFGTSWGYINIEGGVSLMGISTVSMKVAKDGNPTSYFGVRTGWHDGTTGRFAGIVFRTDTGAIIDAQWAYNRLGYGVIDQGDHWLVWFCFDSETYNATQITIYPSHFNISGAGGAIYTGKARLTAIQSEPGHIPGGSSYIKTEGTPLSRAADSLEISALTIAKLLVKHNRADDLLKDMTPSNVDADWIDNGDGTWTSAGLVSGDVVRWTDIGVTTTGSYLLKGSAQGGNAATRLNGSSIIHETGEFEGLRSGATSDGFHFISILGQNVTVTRPSLREVTMPTRYVAASKAVNIGGNTSLGPTGNILRIGNTSWGRIHIYSTAKVGSTFRLTGRIRRLSETHTNMPRVMYRNAVDTGNASRNLPVSDVGVWHDFDETFLVYFITDGTYGLWFDGDGGDFEIQFDVLEEVIQDLTINMAGSFTYSDNNDSSEVMLMRVDPSNDEDTQMKLNTDGDRSGQIQCYHTAEGVFTAVSSNNNQNYQPGIRRDFDIALSLSNTEMSGLDRISFEQPKPMTKLVNWVGEPMQIGFAGVIELSEFQLLLGASGDDLLKELVR